MSLPVYADRYAIDENTTVVGEPMSVLSKYDDTVYSLALKHGVGVDAFANANPDVDPLLPGEGVALHLPRQYILPAGERKGIVINLPEMRLYYFPPDQDSVYIYPVGIGRQGWETPLMQSVITSVKKDPVWTPPESIHEEYRSVGLTLPKQIAAGPDNPLGKYAMRIGDTSYLIHGTNRPEGVGLRVSHGCIRLYPEDIAELAAMVSADTPVSIINQPVKLGRLGDAIYVQAHKPVRLSTKGLSSHVTADALSTFRSFADATLKRVEIASVKQTIKGALANSSLYTGLVIKASAVSP